MWSVSEWLSAQKTPAWFIAACQMHMRHFTQLTNGFSKKVENHTYAVALHMMYYNFVRLHSKLRMSPAMSAGVTEKLWEIG
jgi:hypothetical protein